MLTDLQRKIGRIIKSVKDSHTTFEKGDNTEIDTSDGAVLDIAEALGKLFASKPSFDRNSFFNACGYKQPKTITLNIEQRLFNIPCDGGYTCLGFDVCADWTNRIAEELNRPDLKPKEVGTLQAYEDHETAVEAARVATLQGRRLACMLTPQLIGLEGKRVEVVDRYDETRRFYVGKSTGFLPIHLEINKRSSSGGPGVSGEPFKSVKVIDNK